MALLVGACGEPITPRPATPAARSPSTAPSSAVEVDPVSGLRVVPVAELPAEALSTIRRIRAGGPFADPADDMEFVNTAGGLPVRAAGYYHAFVVPVPGGAAGADLMVAGARGEMYWTTDGALTFVRVVP